MLLRFTVSNYLSFSEEVEFNMFPYTRLREMKDHIYETQQVDLLKSAAIYGANGAGKSNFVKAIRYLRDLVISNDLVQPTGTPQPFRLDKKYADQPSSFCIEFKIGPRYFLYGISIKDLIIEEEFAYEVIPKSRKDDLIFHRRYLAKNIEVEFGEKYRRSEEAITRLDIYVNEILTPAETLIHLLSEYEAFQEAYLIHSWFENNLPIVTPDAFFLDLPAALNNNDQFSLFANGILSQLDTGINHIGLEQLDFDEFFGYDEPEKKQEALKRLNSGEEVVKYLLGHEMVLVSQKDSRLVVSRVFTNHLGVDGKNVKFHLWQESDGTRRIVDFIPLWESLFTKDVTVIVDEIGRSLHPNLLHQLLELFSKSHTTGQLIFTTHDAGLLSKKLFRSDEIWTVNKSKAGNSSMHSISEFKPRHDLDLRKGYLNGRFGGTPNLKHLDPKDLLNETQPELYPARGGLGNLLRS